MEHKISKKNSDYNKTKFSKKTLHTSRKKQKIQGGKPLIGGNVYTYFIIGHGSVSSSLAHDNINLRPNTSIIYLTDLDECALVGHEKEIVNFYINDKHRFFTKQDGGKTLTKEAEDLIQKINKKLPTNPLSPRNHVCDGNTPLSVNNMTITFKGKNDDEFNGVIRYNHTTNKTEHYDINKLKQIEQEYKSTYVDPFNLNFLFHKLFDTDLKNDIYFDNRVTIIPIICRAFDQDLKSNDLQQDIFRSRSAASDAISSADGITTIESSKLVPLDNTKKWIGVGTKVLLSNGIIGFVRDLYVTSVRFNIETFIPTLTVKGLVQNPKYNGKRCAVTEILPTPGGRLGITVLDNINETIAIKPQNIDVSVIKRADNLNRETIIEILEDP
jgi:hypothetical protein